MGYSQKKVVGSLSYKFIEQLSVKGTSLLIGIVLARLLDVADFGVISLLTVFTHLASAIIEGGLSTSLIQMKEVDTKDYSTVFYTSFGLALVLYLVLFGTAPMIAEYYDNSSMCIYLRVTGLNLFVTPFNSIQLGYVYRNMMFKRLLIASLSACVISGGVGIAMAYMGMGAWALVAQTLLSSIVSVVLLFLLIPWKPTAEFSLQKLKEHFGYGWKLLVSSLLETGYIELRTLLIGKQYTTNDLAYYNRGDTYPKTIITSLNTAVTTVMFPVLSSEQGDLSAVKNLTRKTVSLSAFILFPVMAGFASIAEGFVEIVLTDKWAECVVYLQLACLTYAIMPINSCNLQAIKAIGRSDVFLRLTVIKKIVGIILIVAAVFAFNSPLAVAIVAALFAPIELLINALPNRKLIDYHLSEQIKDIFPAFLSSVVMFILVNALNKVIVQVYLRLVVQIVAGVAIYFICSVFAQKAILKESLSVIKKQINRRSE